MAKSKPFYPTRQDRIAAIEHVVYEYANLISAGFHSMHAPASVRTHADDAFLLGYRKLSDFLTSVTRTEDDILAIDFIPLGAIPKWQLPIWKGKWNAAMNKQLAHITYARVLSPQSWDHRLWNGKLVGELRDAWGEFLQAIVDPEYMDEFERQIHSCQSRPGFGSFQLQ